jgi:hypothetical protein
MTPSDSTFSLLRIPKRLATSLLWTMPLYVLGSLTILIVSAGIYVKAVGDQGTWLGIGGWTLLLLYTIVGLAGGVAAAILSAVHRALDTLESALHAGLRQLPALTQAAEREPLSLDEARVHYGVLVDRLLNHTLGYVPLPGWLYGKVRSWIQDAVVGDFITLCRERGLTRVPPQDFRNWLLAKGASLALSPLHDQISLWQYALSALIIFLAVGALLLSYFVG